MAKTAARATGLPRWLALTIVVGASLAGGLAAGYFAVRHARSYARMGHTPEQITAAQASTLPLDGGPRWVRLSDKLQVDCEQALQQTENGNVEFTEYLAQDEAGKHSFFLQYKGDTDCNSAYARPLEGLLAAPPLYWWSKNNMPAPKFEPVELQVGYEPSAELYEGLWASLASLMLLGLGGVIFVKSEAAKAEATRQAMYGGIPVPKSL
jgi:hypothetical protein